MDNVAVRRWFELEGTDLADELCRVTDWLKENYKERHSRALNALCIYEGKRIPGLHPEAYLRRSNTYQTENYDDLHWNLGRSIVQTVLAKVGGTQRPKPQFVTSGADWSTKRRAKKLEKFVEGQLFQRQGVHEHAWDLSLRLLGDAAVFGVGVGKVYSDEDAEKVVLERVFPWEFYVDPLEAEHSQPLSYFHVYPFDRYKLMARFPEFKDVIKNLEPHEDDTYSRGERISDRVLVREAWRVSLGDTNPGKHAICVKGKTLIEEDWERPEPPFVTLRWQPEMIGFWATSLVEEVESICDEVNYTLQRMQEAERLCSNGVFFYQEGTISEEDLRDNSIGIGVPVSPAATSFPTYVAPKAYSESTLQWLQLNVAKVYEIPGVSQMQATSKKEPGVTAAVALRELSDMQTERFSCIYRNYENMFVAMARHIVACTRELASKNRKYQVSWPGKKFLETISWKEADLEEDQYQIQIYPVSGLVNTPADRLQLGQELFNSGIISKESFVRILQVKDVEGELGRQDTQYAVIEKYIDSWLDATQEALDDGDFKFRSPIPFMNLEEALLQVGRAYMEAELEGAPDFNLEFFLRFMTECDKLIQRRAAQQAALAPPGGPGPAPTPSPEMPLPPPGTPTGPIA